MSKFVFTKSRLDDAPATHEMSLEEIVREAAKIHPFSVRRITKYVSTLEVDQVLSWFMIRRVS